VRIFKTKWFARFARKEDISDKKLSEAVQEAEKDLHDGDLGGNLIKKRVARAGEGKRGGYRTIIVYRAGKRAVFVYGFPKSTKANLSAMELDAYQKLAQVYLSFSDAGMAKALSAGELEEVNYNGEEVSE
jgi:hypothetical protein